MSPKIRRRFVCLMKKKSGLDCQSPRGRIVQGTHHPRGTHIVPGGRIVTSHFQQYPNVNPVRKIIYFKSFLKCDV
jgi:hypothetical protein